MNKWDKKELKDYIEKLKDGPNLFAKEYLGQPILQYCHDFGRPHYFVKNRCEFCGIKYSRFRELMEKNDKRI
jgi:hypothetical protein